MHYIVLCPECGRAVLDDHDVCPGCSYPITRGNQKPQNHRKNTFSGKKHNPNLSVGE